MDDLLNIFQVLLSILIVVVILLQVKGIGSGFFGQAYSTFRTRRGLEQLLFRGTIFLVLLMVAVALVRARVPDLFQ
jgi:protein translocase SecG subunit